MVVPVFHGYAPDLGYEFLRNAIAEHDYKARGCDISADEIFVSDGAKSDSANIQESCWADTDKSYPASLWEIPAQSRYPWYRAYKSHRSMSLSSRHRRLSFPT